MRQVGGMVVAGGAGGFDARRVDEEVAVVPRRFAQRLVYPLVRLDPPAELGPRPFESPAAEAQAADEEDQVRVPGADRLAQPAAAVVHVRERMVLEEIARF